MKYIIILYYIGIRQRFRGRMEIFFFFFIFGVFTICYYYANVFHSRKRFYTRIILCLQRANNNADKRRRNNISKVDYNNICGWPLFARDKPPSSRRTRWCDVTHIIIIMCVITRARHGRFLYFIYLL